MARVLFIEKQPDLSATYQTYFELRGYAVGTAPDGASALEAIATDPPDVLLLDVSPVGMHGLEVVRQITAWAPGVNVIVLSDTLDSVTREAAHASGARACFQKPISLHELQTCVTYTLTQSSLPPRWH